MRLVRSSPTTPGRALVSAFLGALSGAPSDPVTERPAAAATPGSAAAAATGEDDLGPLVRWTADEPEPPRILLRCEHDASPVTAPPGAMVVHLGGCAGALTAASYLEVVAAGAAGLGVLVSGCPALDRVEREVEAADRLLGVWPDCPMVRCEAPRQDWRRAQVHDIHRLPVSRRGLLTFALPAPRWAAGVSAGERARLLAVLRRLSGTGIPPALRSLAAGAADLVAPACSACGVCVRACPNGALRLDRAEAAPGGEFTLVSAVAKCDDCGRCVALCPSHTLAKRGQADWAQLLEGRLATVGAGSARRCMSCGATFVDSGSADRCPLCAFRLANPFGSYLPASAPGP